MNFSAIPRDSMLGQWLRWPLKLLPKQMVVPILQGKLKGWLWVSGSSTHGCWLGSYEYEKQQMFQDVITPGSVVYDIGANVGFYSLLGSALVGESGKVIAFEPVPRNLRFLYRHLTLNRVANVVVVEAAVSNKTGIDSFVLGNNPSEGFIGSGSGIQVQTACLDEEVFNQKLPVPDLMKIDVEMFEPEVLEGFKLIIEYKPIIFIELLTDEIAEKVQRLLPSNSYLFYELDFEKLIPIEKLTKGRPHHWNFLLVPNNKQHMIAKFI